MSRRDPINEHGPPPPGGRPVNLNKTKVRWNTPKNLVELEPEEEYHKLWKHVLYGTHTCVEMLEGYTKLGMPGDPLEHLVLLQDRVNKLVEIYSNGKVKTDTDTDTDPHA